MPPLPSPGTTSHALPTSNVQSLIYVPTPASVEVGADRPSPRRRRAVAVLAHPWSHLGGNWDDPIIHSLLLTFLSLSIPATIYQARSWGGWTGRRSIDDYGEVVRAAVAHLKEARDEGGGASGGGDEETGTGEEGVVDVYCCGYSYGSFCAMYQRPLERGKDGARYHFVLISPVPRFLPFFFPFIASPTPLSHHPDSRLICLLGDQDQFASSPTATLSWVRSLGSDEGDQERMTLVNPLKGVDHFWRRPGALREMREAVKGWVEEGRVGRG